MVRRTFRKARKLIDRFAPMILLPISLAVAPGLAKGSSEDFSQVSRTKSSRQKEDRSAQWTQEENYVGGLPEPLISLYEDAILEEDQRAHQAPGYSFSVRELKGLSGLYELLKSWEPGKDFPKKSYINEYWNVPTDVVADSNENLRKAQEDFFNTKLSADSLEEYLEKVRVFSNLCREFAASNEKQFNEAYAKLDLNMDVRGLRQYLSSLNKFRDKEYDEHGNITERYSSLSQEIQHFEETLQNLKWSYEDATRYLTAARQLKIFSCVLDAQYDFLSQDKKALKELLMNYYELSNEGLKRYTDDLSKGWLDLMPTDFYFNTSHSDMFHGRFKILKDQFNVLRADKYAPIYQALELYHAIPKTSEDMLDARIEALKNIAALTWARRQPILDQIAKRAKLKAAYLEKLKLLPKEAEARIFNLPQKVTSNVVRTKADAFHDLDPAKRNPFKIAEAFRRWLSLAKDESSTPHFYLWLETQDTVGMLEDLRHSLLPAKRKLVQFDGAYGMNALFADEKHGFVEDGRYVYNIDEDGDLYILPAFETEDKFRAKYPEMFKAEDAANLSLEDPLNHDVILGGKNILVAGIVQFKDGRIEKIDTNSGHYRPRMIRHLRPALATLLAKHPGVIRSDTQVGNYDGKVNIPYGVFVSATTQDVHEPPEPTKEEVKQWKEKALESRRALALKRVLQKRRDGNIEG